MIRHVVLLKLLDRADAPEAVRRLHELPGRAAGLLTLEAGVDVLGSAASYDVCLVATHDDLDALATYAQDPVHGEFLTWLQPRLGSRVVVDAQF